MKILCTFLPALVALTATAQATREMGEAELRDKIRGAWAGQMIGVSVGWPTEFRALGEMYTKPIAWEPKKIYEALDQDDLYVEMTFCKVLDDKGIDAPAAAFGEAFAKSKYQLWHANFKARQNLIVGIEPPLSGHPDYNIHADDIDFQIESDFIGLMCPGMPNTAARYADRIGHVMNYGDGVYGGMFMAAMYSAALVNDDIDDVIRIGMAVLPEKSEFRRAITWAINAHTRHPDNIAAAWEEFGSRWANTDSCSGGALSPFDIDAKSNAAYVVFGLLYGGGDFERTVEASIQCGQDSDCNPASAAGILGAMRGYSWLPGEWRRELREISSKKFSYTDYSFDSICISSFRQAKAVIAANGGIVNDTRLTIALQSPLSRPAEQWIQDIAVARIGEHDDAFTYEGNWSDRNARYESNTPKDTVKLRFRGTGAIVLGRYGKDCGIAAITIDGKTLPSTNLFYDWDLYGQEPFRGESIAHVFGLEPGQHTLEITVTGDRHADATDCFVGIEGAVLFDGREPLYPSGEDSEDGAE